MLFVPCDALSTGGILLWPRLGVAVCVLLLAYILSQRLRETAVMEGAGPVNQAACPAVPRRWSGIICASVGTQSSAAHGPRCAFQKLLRVYYHHRCSPFLTGWPAANEGGAERRAPLRQRYVTSRSTGPRIDSHSELDCGVDAAAGMWVAIARFLMGLRHQLMELVITREPFRSSAAPSFRNQPQPPSCPSGCTTCAGLT